jgi:hypothetical protein
MAQPTVSNQGQFNEDLIRAQISQKLNYSKPWYASAELATSVITDRDTFPYQRFYRGKFNEENPRIFEREAGFRKLNNPCYTPMYVYPEETQPNLCWEGPCSATYPCIPEFSSKFTDKQAYRVQLNRMCPSYWI